MATPNGQLYCKSLALFIWFQNIDRSISGNYNIELPEMDFLASKLSPQECYDFYTQLSHRKAIHGGVSIYAQKEKIGQLPCKSLLTTWLTDPEESPFRSHESIELKLRKIGRKDLARWIIKRIETSLQRKRRLYDEGINRQMEESEKNGSIVVDRIGEKIMPVVSMKDQQTGIKSENIGIYLKDNFRVFWQIFLSVVIVLLLILLFTCFYKFFCRKLRCICHRSDFSGDRKCCLPEQKYGTTSGSDLSPKKTKKTCNFFPRKKRDNKIFSKSSNFLSTKKCSSANERNEEKCTIEEKKSLLLNLTNNWKQRNFNKKNSNFRPEEKSYSTIPKNEKSSKLFYETLQRRLRDKREILARKKVLNSRSENIFQLDKIGRKNLNNIDCCCSEKMLSRSFSPEKLHFSGSTSSRIFSSRTLTQNERESDNIDFDGNYEEENLYWTSCSCNELSKCGKKNSPTNSEERREISDKIPEFYCRQSQTKNCDNENPEWNSCFCIEMSESVGKKSPDSRKNFPTEISTHSNFSEFHDFNSQSEITNFQQKTTHFCTSKKISEAQQKNSLATTQISPPKNEKSGVPIIKSSEMKNSQEEIPNFTLCIDEKNFESHQKNSLASTKICQTQNRKNTELPNEKSSNIKSSQEKNLFFCIEVPKIETKNSLEKNLKNAEIFKEKWSENTENDNLRYSRGDANSELSETYNELGMLFSEEMKRQLQICRRNYCPLSRNLRTRKNHDEQKCKMRFRANFGYKIIKINERPACSSAEICKDTYDEFELMKATRKKDREKLARSIFERRKWFLDQPCLSSASGNDSNRN